jgi:glycosyltransferase involved in cell wall biosynthesis
VPKVLDHHNIESHMLLRRSHNEKNVLKKMYFFQEGIRLKRYEARFCPRFSLNITCSDVDSQRLQSIAPAAKVLTIPNGVDMDFFRPAGHPLDPHRLIFVGSMNWYPNIEAVLYIAEKLWPKLKQMHSDLEFHVVGANPPEIIRALAKRLSGFHVHGYVDDVRPFMETAAVYVCPIQDGGGTKLKILDAMAMQKAVVAHPLACEGINVTHGENVLLADNPAIFLEQIYLLLRDPEKGRKLGIAARKLVSEEYDYQAIGRKLSEAYRHCAIR